MTSEKEDDENILNLSLTCIETMAPRDLYKYSKILQIKDFGDMSELKQKIILSVMKKKEFVIETNFYTKDFQEKKELTFTEDALRRQYLSSYVTEIESIYKNIGKLAKIRTTSPGGIDVSEKDDPLITKINNEFVNLDQQFKTKKDLISKKPNCALLICGDSGAGKSSFINLLINEPLLPTSIRSNTACQVKLTYDKHERAEIMDLDGKMITIEKKDFANDLKQYLENLDNRTQLSCKSATVFLNCPVLEGGLDIYDTIGLGETQLFNEELTKDLKDITGILFLLKRNNPIGDNTVGGLSKVINHMAKNGIPGGSMHFIINMCDLLDGSKEKDELKKNVTEQIRDKCAGLSPDITTFSTKRELFLQENKYMSKDYEDIMTLIHHLHLNSINTNTVSIFEFLFRFVWKTIEYIKESEQFAAADRVDKREYIHKLRNLEVDRKLLNQAFKKNNERFLKDKFQRYKKEVENHFNSDDTKAKVVTEVVNKHNLLFGMTNNDEIDKEIMSLTQNAILKNFKEFIEEQNLLRNCCDQMLTIFLQQFAEHQKKKDTINQEMNRHIDSVMNYIKGDLTTMDFNDLIGLPIYQRRVLQLFAPIMVPGIEFKNTVKKEIESLFAWVISRINLANIQKFYEDTRTYVKNKSASYYSKFVGGRKNIRMIMDCLFEAPQQVTRDFDKYLAEDMNYLAKNIDLLYEDMRNRENVVHTYKEIKEKLEELNNELCRINLLYLQKEKGDIMRDEMEINSKDHHKCSGKNDPILKNRNRYLYCGHFKDTPLTDSAILVYKNVDEKNWNDIYQEYIRHKEISKDNSGKLNCFITIRYHILSSISDHHEIYPMFTVKGIDHSLKTYIKEYKQSIEKESGHDMLLHREITRILRQILNGLIYLHKENLVHYDLTMESIGYNSTYGTIKLSSIALETAVKIDHSAESRSYVHEVAHLPREILDKELSEKYTSKSDIYCLGNILYQLWVDIHPFFDFIENKEIITVEQFVGRLKITKLNNLILPHLFHGGFAQTAYTWATLCWENKFTASDFQSFIAKPFFYGTTSN